ncbi:MAG: hypothetical protein FJ320_02190 [SAR202 cluster bacterium]|nr:hypothetical protein [SAR202 cluster bacterium]
MATHESDGGGGRVKGGMDQMQWLASVAAAISFIAGYVLSVIAGIANDDISGSVSLALVIMGLLVGLFNITGKEIIPYLVAAIALVLVGTADPFTTLNDVAGGFGDHLNLIVSYMAIFTAPAAVIQAIKAGIILARPGDDHQAKA